MKTQDMTVPALPADMAKADSIYSESGVCAINGDTLAISERVNAWIAARQGEGFKVEVSVRSNGAVLFCAWRRKYVTSSESQCIDAYGRTVVFG